MDSWVWSWLIRLLVTLSGVFAHLCIWIRGEWDPHSGRIFTCTVLAHLALSACLLYPGNLDVRVSQSAALSIEACHLVGVFGSMTVYRIWFHPLHRFPGPVGAKIWIWDIFARTWFSGDRHSVVIDKMHSKFGPIVRYAPNRLSINFAAAVPLIHGSGSSSKCTKSVVYLNPVNGGSINADRDVKSHHARRKTWERALAARALSSYVPALTQLTASLVARLMATDAVPTSVNKHMQLFTFDAMGLIGFGRQGGFDGLRTGILHPAITELIEMMRIGVYMMLVPWLHMLLDYVPTMGIIHKPDEVFRVFAKDTLHEYCDVKDKEKGGRSDIESSGPLPFERKHTKYGFKSILSQIHPNPSLGDRRTLSDCVLLSIAGADTTTSSLVHTIYRLARHRELQTRLYEEIARSSPSGSHMYPGQEAQVESWIGSAKLPLIEAFIQEVLRLHPPAPTGLPRLTPSEGLVFACPDGTNEVIPGDTNVSVPVYTLLRSASSFAQPLEFVPERFLPPSHPESRPDLIRDNRAYIPFLQGPYGCAGKQLAYLEMKIVIATLISQFEIILPDTMTLDDVHRRIDTEWRDYSTVKAAPLEAQFLPRPVIMSGDHSEISAPLFIP